MKTVCRTNSNPVGLSFTKGLEWQMGCIKQAATRGW